MHGQWQKCYGKASMSIYYFYYSEVVNNTGIHVPNSLTLGTFGLVPRLQYSTLSLGFYEKGRKPQIDMLTLEEVELLTVFEFCDSM